jgi:hypothetical protein
MRAAPTLHGFEVLMEIEVDEEDWTTPAPPPTRPTPCEFVLQLPPSMIRKLEEISAASEIQKTVEHKRSNARLFRASAIAGSALIVVVGLVAGASAATGSGSDGPVGIARHAPKTLDESIRAHDRVTGSRKVVPTVSHHHHR